MEGVRKHLLSQRLPWLSHRAAVRPRSRREALPDDPASQKPCTSSWVEFWGTPNALAYVVLPSSRAGPFPSSEDPGDLRVEGNRRGREGRLVWGWGQGYRPGSEDQQEWETAVWRLLGSDGHRPSIPG